MQITDSCTPDKIRLQSSFLTAINVVYCKYLVVLPPTFVKPQPEVTTGTPVGGSLLAKVIIELQGLGQFHNGNVVFMVLVIVVGMDFHFGHRQQLATVIDITTASSNG